MISVLSLNAAPTDLKNKKIICTLSFPLAISILKLYNINMESGINCATNGEAMEILFAITDEENGVTMEVFYSAPRGKFVTRAVDLDSGEVVPMFGIYDSKEAAISAVTKTSGSVSIAI